MNINEELLIKNINIKDLQYKFDRMKKEIFSLIEINSILFQKIKKRCSCINRNKLIDYIDKSTKSNFTEVDLSEIFLCINDTIYLDSYDENYWYYANSDIFFCK